MTAVHRPAPDAPATGDPAPSALLLGSTAARSCPVKTWHAFDPTAPAPPETAGRELPSRRRAARDAEARLLEQLIAAAPGLVVDLRLLADDPAASTEACLRAMAVGATAVVGGTLPADPDGHRRGRPDLLLRGADRPDGRPSYHPAEVKAHRLLLARRPGEEQPAPPLAVSWTPFATPHPGAARPLADVGFRLGSREGDLRQLAHYRRMLEAAGYAAASPLAAVAGPDTLLDETPGLVWVDLAEPAVRTFSRSTPEGWRLRSVLDRYDHDHALRVAVARQAAARTGNPDRDPVPLVAPVVQDECARCPWWGRCRPALDDDDVSLRIDKGALDVREVLALRRLGVGTVPALAAADLDGLLPRYLPEVTHRLGAEGRLRVAARRARMLRDGVPFDRETEGPVPVPAGEVEVDLDLESSADGRVYLWGFLVHDRAAGSPPRYVQFSRFTVLDEADEAALAAEAFGWLRGLVEAGPATRVYHYSAYEPQVIRGLASRSGRPELAWAAAYTAELVDLYEVVKAHFFGASGLGLKPIARHAGFRWRDEDPGGLNSQLWFAEAVADPDPEVRQRARTRVLEYNEDDVRATAALRAWLRAQ